MGRLAVYLLAGALAVAAMGAGVYALAFDEDDPAPIVEIEGRPTDDDADGIPEPELQPPRTDDDGDTGDDDTGDGDTGATVPDQETGNDDDT